jgi:hypothetical protein
MREVSTTHVRDGYVGLSLPQHRAGGQANIHSVAICSMLP